MSVTAAKPAVGGAISVAALGSTLPTSASATLDAAFTQLGYNTEDGVTRSMNQDTDVVKAWGGDVVLVLENGKTETFKFAMMDTHSTATLKLYFGDDNVTGSALATGIAAVSNNDEKGGHAFVIDMIEKGNTLHRIVIPNGYVTALEDVKYVDNGAVTYGVTITAVADSSGNTAYDYFVTASD